MLYRFFSFSLCREHRDRRWHYAAKNHTVPKDVQVHWVVHSFMTFIRSSKINLERWWTNYVFFTVIFEPKIIFVKWRSQKFWQKFKFWFLILPIVMLSLSKEGQHSESQIFHAFQDKNDSKNSFMFTILNEKTSFFTFMFICSSYF